jgi:hypothetical protein
MMCNVGGKLLVVMMFVHHICTNQLGAAAVL